MDTEIGHIPADLILLMPGMTGPAWARDSGLPLSEGGMIQGDEFCQVTSLERVFVAGDAGSLPGPDWMPKQAHMADLQAKAAATNLAPVSEGKLPEARYRPELICIIDTLDAGIPDYRDAKRAWVLPSSIFWQWMKRMFDRFYLHTYRR